MLESSPDDSRSHKLPTEHKIQTAMSPPPSRATPPEPADAQSQPQVRPTEDEEMPDAVGSEASSKSTPDEVPQLNAPQNIKHESPPINDSPAPIPEVPLTTSAVENLIPDEVVDQRDDVSEDSYSPPPAVEPPPEVTNEEVELQKQEAASKAAAEEQVRREAETKAEEERIAEEKAVEELRLKQEAEERRQKEEEEIAMRRQEEEKQERERQEMEAKRRMEQLEQERRRLDALPVVLAKTAQMIDEDNPEVRSQQWLNKYLPLYSVRTRQLDPTCEASVAEDEWVPNFQVAGLLTTKDLNLSNYSTFGKKPVTDHQRQCLWRVARLKLSYGANSLRTVAISKATEIERIAEEKFMSMAELFWVKFSDFMDQVYLFSHLADLNLARQAISLKSYEEILGARMKTSNLIERHVGLGLPNGVVPHTNGENGII